jgi:hypothetical protein
VDSDVKVDGEAAAENVWSKKAARVFMETPIIYYLT